MKQLLYVLSVLLCYLFASTLGADPAAFQIASFRIDATPPLGSALCNGNVTPVMKIVSPLTARGVVLLGAGKPIVLCAFDWVGIGNGSYDAFREALAVAVRTSPDRVALHTLPCTRCISTTLREVTSKLNVCSPRMNSQENSQMRTSMPT